MRCLVIFLVLALWSERTPAQPPVPAPSPSERLQLAQQLLAADRARDAEKIASEVVATNPKDAVAWNLLGQARVGMREYPGAVEAFGKALELLPGDPNLEFNRAVALYELRDPDAAEAFERVLAKEPQRAVALVYLGRIASDANEDARATAFFDRAVAVLPPEPLARYYRGLLFTRTGRHDAARADFEACLAISPDLPSAHWNLGLVLRRLGKPEAAEPHLRRFRELQERANAVSQTRQRVVARILAAKQALEAGMPEKALELALEARTIGPEVPVVHAMLERIYTALGRREDARNAKATAERLSRAKPGG